MQSSRGKQNPHEFEAALGRGNGLDSQGRHLKLEIRYGKTVMHQSTPIVAIDHDLT